MQSWNNKTAHIKYTISKTKRKKQKHTAYDLGSVALDVFVMYQNTWDWLTVDYLIVYKALPIVCHTYFHKKNSTLACVPEDIVMHSLYAKITFAITALFPDVYFVSYNNCVFIVFSVAILGYNICVCHLLSNEEIYKISLAHG